MRRLLGIVTVLAAWGQQTTPNPLTGFVEKVDGGELHVRAGKRLVVFICGEGTQVWKNGTFRNPEPLTRGDEVRVGWKSAAGSQKPVIATVATMIRFAGVIADATPERLEIRNRTTNETRLASLEAHTVFGSRRSDLTVGQDVLVTGWDVGSGRIEASRIAVYNTDLPALR